MMFLVCMYELRERAFIEYSVAFQTINSPVHLFNSSVIRSDKEWPCEAAAVGFRMWTWIRSELVFCIGVYM